MAPPGGIDESMRKAVHSRTLHKGALSRCQGGGGEVQAAAAAASAEAAAGRIESKVGGGGGALGGYPPTVCGVRAVRSGVGGGGHYPSHVLQVSRGLVACGCSHRMPRCCRKPGQSVGARQSASDHTVMAGSGS